MNFPLYHSCKQAFKSGVGREREGSNYDNCTRTIIMAESNILGNTLHTVSPSKSIPNEM